MSSKLLLNKDFNSRLSSKSYKINNKIRNVLLRDCFISLKSRLVSIDGLKIDKTKGISRIKNRCLLTGRSRAVYSYFKLTRMVFKKLAVGGSINGVSKYSW